MATSVEPCGPWGPAQTKRTSTGSRDARRTLDRLRSKIKAALGGSAKCSARGEPEAGTAGDRRPKASEATDATAALAERAAAAAHAQGRHFELRRAEKAALHLEGSLRLRSGFRCLFPQPLAALAALAPELQPAARERPQRHPALALKPRNAAEAMPPHSRGSSARHSDAEGPKE